MTTPRVTVPVEDLAGKLKAIRDKFLMPTPDKDFTDYAIMTRCVEALSAAPAPGGTVNVPGGYLVKDFADGWYWTPNAALDHAGGGPVWSVADGRYETDPPALAAREEAPAPCKSCNGSGMDAGSRFNRCPDCCEEAPAEAGALEWSRFKQMCEEKLSDAIKADHGDAPFPMDESEAASYHRTRADLLGWVLDMWPTEPPALRAQPPAREDAEPVGWRMRRKRSMTGAWSFSPEEPMADPKTWDLEDYEVQPLYTRPAPDKLRVAVEALEPFARVMIDVGESESDDDTFRNARREYARGPTITVGHVRRASKALSALQAEQKGGA